MDKKTICVIVQCNEEVNGAPIETVTNMPASHNRLGGAGHKSMACPGDILNESDRSQTMCQ